MLETVEVNFQTQTATVKLTDAAVMADFILAQLAAAWTAVALPVEENAQARRGNRNVLDEGMRSMNPKLYDLAVAIRMEHRKAEIREHRRIAVCEFMEQIGYKGPIPGRSESSNVVPLK